MGVCSVTDMLELSVWDEDMLWDDFMGAVSVPVAALLARSLPFSFGGTPANPPAPRPSPTPLTHPNQEQR